MYMYNILKIQEIFYYKFSYELIKCIKEGYQSPIENTSTYKDIELSLNKELVKKEFIKTKQSYLKFLEDGVFRENNYITLKTLESYRPNLISIIKDYLKENKPKRNRKRNRIKIKKQNFLESSSAIILNLYKELKSFCLMNNFDIDYTQYKDLIEINVSCDSLLITSITNKFNELELMFQLLATIYYLNSDKFKKDFLNITSYREKIFKCVYYNLPKVVNETIFFENGEWVDYTKKIGIKVEEPNNTPYMDIGYPILRSLIQLYVLP